MKGDSDFSRTKTKHGIRMSAIFRSFCPCHPPGLSCFAIPPAILFCFFQSLFCERIALLQPFLEACHGLPGQMGQLAAAQAAFAVTQIPQADICLTGFRFPAISSIHQGMSHKPDSKAPVLLDFLSIPKYYTRKKVTYDSINGQNRRCI